MKGDSSGGQNVKVGVSEKQSLIEYTNGIVLKKELIYIDEWHAR